uniref:Uncharacterized protein n=1 Tax=Ascaris lumbricoides TaxID=6252 RepID=A0A0M3HIU5_ASCLU
MWQQSQLISCASRWPPNSRARWWVRSAVLRALSRSLFVRRLFSC